MSGTPRPHRGRNRRRVPRRCAALAVAVTLVGCSHPRDAADTTGSTEPASGTSGSAAPGAPPAVADARGRLLKLVPAGYPPDACTPAPALGGAVAAVSCGRNTDVGGPPSATYTLFVDAGTLQLSFDNAVQTTAVTECPGRIQSPGPWHHTANPGKPAGMLMCGNSQDRPTVVWTNDDQLLLSVARADRSGPALEQLYSWWSSHS